MRSATCAAATALMFGALAAPGGAWAADATAAGSGSERLQVAEAFIELHTGPGRGYPVFHVAARHEWIRIELRHTDWYKVRTEGGQLGWVQRAQLETTLTEAGGTKTFRDIVVDDFLRRRVELGAAWGQFKTEPMLKVWTAYRWSDALALEASFGQVQGRYSGTEFWHLNLHIEPWSDQRLSPTLGVGIGKFRNVPNNSLVDAVGINAQLAVANVGLRYHISDRFVGRVDYGLYTAFVADTRSTEYRAFTLGLSFFF
jgi:hypothetical protein